MEDYKKIFIDAGAHLGESIEYFLKSNIPDKDKFEIHSFEAHPWNFKKLKKKYNKHTKINCYNCAIWDKNEEKINFYQRKNFNYNASSSLLKNKKTGNLDTLNPIFIKSIDFSKFILKNFKINDYIILKMDIEGAEYKVLEKMFQDGSINYINIILIEFHNLKVDINKDVDDSIIKMLNDKNIKVITEDMVANGEDPRGNWFQMLSEKK